MGQVDQYASWVRGLDFVEVTDSELEAAAYEAADKPWVEGNTDAARRGLEKYLQQFPAGVNHLEARFRLAQLYYADNRAGEALELYRTVADAGSGESGEQALTRVCEILVSRGETREALPYLERLEATADIPQNRTFAQSNLMKGYYEGGDYPRTLAYAEKVLASPSLDDRIRSDAQVMIARSAWQTSDFDRARSAYARVSEIGPGAVAAEALYSEAYFKRQDGALEASNAAVQRLARDFSAYREWGGKGLLLMARNFDDMEDTFQATYILENVISNFSAYPDLVAEARTELAAIKARASENNASVNPQDNE